MNYPPTGSFRVAEQGTELTGEPLPFRDRLRVLRRAFSKPSSFGVISYLSENGRDGTLEVEGGAPPDDGVSRSVLVDFFNNKIVHAGFIPAHTIPEGPHHRRPPFAFTHVLNELHLPLKDIKELILIFSRLPAVKVEMAAMHKLGYHDGLSYLSLYQTSLHEEEFFLKDFFLTKNSFMPDEAKVKVVILGYCLGLINPAHPPAKKAARPQPSVAKPQESTPSSFAKMILSKIRGL